ncbi:ankyrin repeat-containing protein NPR4-like isoform X1 [Senna tora]|uniref:Ankyrin repeat-containing protein NPR4-like isoform X1 n=1 Tax=Senna tora TaxID=362788 RepID=A0A834TDP4_9FABA|nr:ankyrin repeat-containing protein NPR4-like isoform X1 [Senna tora]
MYKAICDNNWQIAREMVEQDSELLCARLTPSGQTPLHVAALFRHLNLVEELVKKSPKENLEIVDSFGNTPLIIAIVTGDIGISKCMVERNTKILGIPTPSSELPVSLAFRYGHKEMGRYLYSVTPFEFLVPERGHLGPQLLRCCLLTQDLGTQKYDERQLVEEQKAEILEIVCESVKTSKVDAYVIADAMFRAAKEGNAAFVVRVSKASPEVLLIPERESHRNLFFYAVEYRQAKVFNLIHGLRFKNSLASGIDKEGNTLLHVAAMLAPPSQLNRINGEALQMQSELLWFKEVESVVPPTIRVGAQNNYGITAEETFRTKHEELRKEGEKWIKKTASSGSVVAALILTITFAAAFTIPGGNNQEFGYPLFLKQGFFKLFIFSTILSVLSSSTSVLMFLGVLTSRYSEEDFLKSLPTKLIIGLSTLFLSIPTMIIAFLAAIHLMLKHSNYSWGLLPILVLASVPLSLLVFSLFPLLLSTTFYTFGDIFDRNVEPWP